jgi:signal transduction histidine kinase
LTLLYGVLFLVAGAGLLAINYALLSRSTPGVSQVTSEDVIARANKLLSDPKLPTEERIALQKIVNNGPAGIPAVSRNAGSLPGSLGKQLFADLPSTVRSDALHQLLVQSLVALAVMAVLSIALGWFVAGRVLRPLQAITSTAQRLSATDLSARIELHGPNDELKQLADTFDNMLARLDAAFTGQRRFVANASHELRTPLTIMRTELDVVLDRPESSNDELRAMGEVLRTTVDRCDRLVSSLLTLAFAENGLDVLEAVEVSSVVRAVVDRRRSDIDERGLQLHVDLAPAVVEGDPSLLDRAVDNLVDNAIVHNQDGGWIQVWTRVADQRSVIVVENSSAEMPPELLPELFEPFRRLDERTGSQRGIGIGLSIVRAVATAHRGDAAIEPIGGGGLRVTLSIPQRTAEGPTSRPASTAGRTVMAEPPNPVAQPSQNT